MSSFWDYLGFKSKPAVDPKSAEGLASWTDATSVSRPGDFFKTNLDGSWGLGVSDMTDQAKEGMGAFLGGAADMAGGGGEQPQMEDPTKAAQEMTAGAFAKDIQDYEKQMAAHHAAMQQKYRKKRYV